MRILLIAGGCNVGGLVTSLINLRRAYVRLGHEAEFFFFNRGNAEDALDPDSPVTYGKLGKVIDLVLERDYDVVHCAISDEEHGMTLLRRYAPRPAIVTVSHGGVGTGWSSRNCSAVVCVASWLVPKVSQFTNLPVRVIHNGVDLTRFNPPREPAQGPPVLAWVGRARDLPVKRIDRLAAIAPRLRAEGIRLWVASPTALDSVEDPEARRILSETVERWESLTPEEMPRFYRDVASTGGSMLLTSKREGFPFVLLEAQACGCPVIVPDIPGALEAADPAEGAVVFPLESAAEDLAGVVIRTLGEPQAQARRSAQAVARIERDFSIESNARKYLALYESAPDQPVRFCNPIRAWYFHTRYRDREWYPVYRREALESLRERNARSENLRRCA